MKSRICGICKVEFPLSNIYFHKDRSRTEGFMFICKVCEKKRTRAKYLKNPRKFRYHLLTPEQKAERLAIAGKYRKTPKGKAIFYLKAYQKFDRKRGYDCDIDQSYLLESFKKPCVYCGDKSVGVDRIFNNKGHTKENLVPCCKECNTGRMDNFTHEEMMTIGKAIAEVKRNRTLSILHVAI